MDSYGAEEYTILGQVVKCDMIFIWMVVGVDGSSVATVGKYMLPSLILFLAWDVSPDS